MGKTQLMKAARSGQQEIVQLLLDWGAQPNIKDRCGRTAVEIAASVKHDNVVKLLVSHGADIDLATASLLGDTDLVRQLITRGVDVNTRTAEGLTPLMLATQRGKDEVAELLLANGADVDAVTNDGWTALDFPTNVENSKIEAILRSHGAKPAEAAQLEKHARNVLRRGDELFFRLANGRIVSRKDSPKQEADTMSDVIGQPNESYRFADFLEPWYVITESYMEGAGVHLLNRDSGQSVEAYGYGVFSPDKTRFLAIGYPGSTPCSIEIWKMTNSGPIKECDLEHHSFYSFRWCDSWTLEVLYNDGSDHGEVIGFITMDGATRESCGSVEGSKPLDIGPRTEVSAYNGEDERDLARAALDGDSRLVRKLLEDRDFVSDALITASIMGHVQILKTLLESWPVTNRWGTSSMKSEALDFAASEGHKEVVRLLLSHGAKLTLQAAAAIGDRETVLRLIREGADVNETTERCESAFLSAVRHEHWDLAITLLENGAQVKDEFGLYRALFVAAAREGHIGMIRSLLARGFAKRGDLSYPLEAASAEGRLEIVGLLLDNGADVNATDKHGRSPLMAAAIRGRLHMSRVLLARGADVNARDAEGATPLMDASWGGNPQLVQLLLSKGARVNDKDKHGRTALMMATSGEIKELLLEHDRKE